MEKFIALPHVTDRATAVTVALFNTTQRIKKDAKGKFTLVATRPHLDGVMVVKKYITT